MVNMQGCALSESGLFSAMSKLSQISGLSAQAVEILEAVGYLDVQDMATADLDELVEELALANRSLHIMEVAPTKNCVERWRATALLAEGTPSQQASGLAGTDMITGEHGEVEHAASKEDTGPGTTMLNLESKTRIREMLARSPEAIPLDGLSPRQGLGLEQVSDGLLLSRLDPEIKFNVMAVQKDSRAPDREDQMRQMGLRPSRVRRFEDAANEDYHVKPLEKAQHYSDSVFSRGLNKGLDRGSRRFIRGVMHPKPRSVYWASCSWILFEIVLVLAVVGIPLLLVKTLFFNAENTPVWAIGLLLAVVFTFSVHLFFGTRARCRVCGQHPLMAKKCVKHMKAHHIPLIGYLLPTAIQALIFKWFYCTYCGTAIRLKK